MDSGTLKTPAARFISEFLAGRQNNGYTEDRDESGSNENSTDTLIVFSSSVDDSSLESQAQRECKEFNRQNRRKIKRTSLSATSSPYLSHDKGTHQYQHHHYANQYPLYFRSHSSHTPIKSTKRLANPPAFSMHRGSDVGFHSSLNQLSNYSNGHFHHHHHFRSFPHGGSDRFQRKQSASSLGGSSVASLSGSTDLLDDSLSKPFMCTAVYDYDAQNEDELSLRRGDIIQVLSKEPKISGDEGWWTGKLKEQVGIFPGEFVQETDVSSIEPLEIPSSELTNRGRVIGVGGFGQVYLACWRGQTVAIKSSRPDPNDSFEKAIDRVREEAKIFWTLRHENIVALLGVFYDNEKCELCLVMEYARGGPLSRVLAGAGRNIQPKILLDWAIQLANGMNYVHNGAPISVIHRDLKSSNILVNEEILNEDFSAKTLKITDFGLAREVYKTTMMSAAAGTYAWMAPEAIAKQLFSKASDVWSYGVVLWELLTGETPYNGMEGIAVAYQVASQKLKLPIPKTCPEDWRTIMEACWRTDPHQRPSFEELVVDLRKLSTSFAGKGDFQQLQSTWKVEVNATLEAKKIEIQSREDEMKKIQAFQEARELELRQREQNLMNREMDVLQRELGVMMLHPTREKVAPVPKARKGIFNKRKALKKTQAISNPSDFRHMFSVQTAERKGKESRSFSSPETPPVSPHTPLRAIVLPADGVKGRTWGPSSFHQKERSTILSQECDSPKRWSKSAPNLEKSQKNSFSSGSGRTLEELDYGNSPVSRKPFSGRNCVTPGENPKPSKISSLQKAISDMSSFFANIVMKQNIQKFASPSQSKSGESTDSNPPQIVFMDGIRNDAFRVGDECQPPTKYSNTYHGHTKHHRNRLNFWNEKEGDRKTPIIFTNDIPNRAPSPIPSQSQAHLQSEQPQRQKKLSPFSTPPPSHRSRFDSPITSESEIFYPAQGHSVFDDYIDSHYSTEEMHQHPHPPSSFFPRVNTHGSQYNCDPFNSPDIGTYDFHPEYSELRLSQPHQSGSSYHSVQNPPIHIHPEAVYRMELANTSPDLGYFTQRATHQSQPQQGISQDGDGIYYPSSPLLPQRCYAFPYRSLPLNDMSSPGRLSRQNSLESHPLTERPITLDLPRPLRSSLRKYNYPYSPATVSLNTPALSSRTSGTWTDSGTPPDSSLSEDSSYVSARESSPSFTSHSSANRSVRFSPITLDSLPRENLMMDMKGETLLELSERARLEAYGSSSPRNDYSTLRRLDYDKMEFLYNF